MRFTRVGSKYHIKKNKRNHEDSAGLGRVKNYPLLQERTLGGESQGWTRLALRNCLFDAQKYVL